jgi:hypothetical protein
MNCPVKAHLYRCQKEQQKQDLDPWLVYSATCSTSINFLFHPWVWCIPGPPALWAHRSWPGVSMTPPKLQDQPGTQTIQSVASDCFEWRLYGTWIVGHNGWGFPASVGVPVSTYVSTVLWSRGHWLKEECIGSNSWNRCASQVVPILAQSWRLGPLTYLWDNCVQFVLRCPRWPRGCGRKPFRGK